MPNEAANEARAWPSAGEMRVARAILLGAVAVIAAALLRHYDRIFDFAAIAIVASSALLYKATHPRQSDRPSPPDM
jgi:hypothetical protein